MVDGLTPTAPAEVVPWKKLLVQSAFLIAIAVILPSVERMASNPDFLEQLRRRHRSWKKKMHLRNEQAELICEALLGVWQAEDYLRRQWRRNEIEQ